MNPLIRYSIFVISGLVTFYLINRFFGDVDSLYLLGFTVVLVGAAVVDILSDKGK